MDLHDAPPCECRDTSPRLRLRFLLRGRMWLAPIEAPADDRLKQHMVSGLRYANPEPEVDLPLRRHVQIKRRNKLLRLIRERIEPSDWAETAVILQAKRNHLGKAPRDLRVGSKLPSSPRFWTCVSLLQCRID